MTNKILKKIEQFSIYDSYTVIPQYLNQMKVINGAYGGIKFSSLQCKHKKEI